MFFFFFFFESVVCIELATQAIVHAELARVSSRAAVDGLLAGLVIALPPVLNYASPELYEKVVPDVSGKMIFKIINLNLDFRH